MNLEPNELTPRMTEAAGEKLVAEQHVSHVVAWKDWPSVSFSWKLCKEAEELIPADRRRDLVHRVADVFMKFIDEIKIERAAEAAKKT